MHGGVRMGTIRRKGQAIVTEWGRVICLVSSGERGYWLAGDNSLSQMEPTAKEGRLDDFLKHGAPAIQQHPQPR